MPHAMMTRTAKRTMMMIAMASFSWTMAAVCVASWRCLVGVVVEVFAAGIEDRL